MSYNQYVGQAAGSDAILGHILWFTIPSIDVHVDTVKNAVASSGVNAKHLRTDFRPVDAYRKASKEIENRFPKNEQGIMSHFLVRPVGQDSDAAHRHVVLERARNEKGKKRRLLYQTVAEIIFWRGEKKNGTYSGYRTEVHKKDLVTVDLTTQEEEWLDIHLNNFNARFRHYMTHLDSNAIRQFVRDTLCASMNAVAVRQSGGVYYVQDSYRSQLDTLSDFMSQINCDFHDLPLVDLDEQREMVLKAFQEETVDDLHRATEEIAGILSNPSRTIRQSTFMEKAAWATQILTKASEIEATLDRKADRVRTEVDLFKQQLLTLTARVED